MNIWSGKQIIPVFWWHKGKLNMGDEASGYIVRNITPLRIRRIGIPISPYDTMKTIFYSLKNLRIPQLQDLHINYGNAPYLMGLGSILLFAHKNSIIWGSGFQDPQIKFKGGRIFAVRGVETARRLKQDGIKIPEVMGDPGLLMPLLYRPQINKRCDIGIIPHIKERHSVNLLAKKYGLKVIDLETDDVEGTIKSILKCRCVLSSSLHGLIFSHAYGIPALFFSHVHKGEGLFKYHDYFSSVNIPYYKPYKLEEIITMDIASIKDFINNNEYALPKTSIAEIQKNLLSVAPFPLWDIFTPNKIDILLKEEENYINSLIRI